MRTRLALFYRRLARDGASSGAERAVLALLLPLSWLYALLMRLRALAYRRGWLQVYRAAVPVISVGNLAVGGSGKTPLVDFLLREPLRGRRVAVVSRGYGGQLCGSVQVVSGGDGRAPLLSAVECGDEPYLLARRNPQVVVIIAARRRDGIDLARRRFGVEAVVLDDAFQHLAVWRDLDILLFDSRCPLGNGHVLPAGLLREPLVAARRADVLACSRCRQSNPPAPVELGGRPLLWLGQRLAHVAVDSAGAGYPLEQLRAGRCVACAGIAEPERFFSDLRRLGVKLVATLALADHCRYGTADLERLQALLTDDIDYLLVTEKDMVKLQDVALPVTCCSVALEMEIVGDDVLSPRVQELFNKVDCGE